MKNKRIKIQLLTCALVMSSLTVATMKVEADNYMVAKISKSNTLITTEKLSQIVDSAKEAHSAKVQEIAEAKAAEEERLRLEEEERQRKIEEEARQAVQSTQVRSNGSGLTKSSGVNWYNGWRETYYSSRVLYHYMTPQWTAGADGVYRDSDGYVIVSSSSESYGTITDTSFGIGKVYDTGCALGTHDIYVNW